MSRSLLLIFAAVLISPACSSPSSAAETDDSTASTISAPEVTRGGTSSFDLVYASRFLIPGSLGWQSGPQAILVNTGSTPIDLSADFQVLDVQANPPPGTTVRLRGNTFGLSGAGVLPPDRAVGGSSLPTSITHLLVDETRVTSGGDLLNILIENVPAAFTTFTVTATISINGDTRPISIDIVSDPGPARWENAVRQSSIQP